MENHNKSENASALLTPLPWKTIIGYGLGDVANNFAFAMGSLFLLSYYTDVAGMDAAAIGTMLLCVRVFDAFADVFAGRVVDSVKTRWGKFRPFLIFASIPLMIISVFVFYVPSSLTHGEKLVYAYATYAALGLFYSLTNIPYGSLATAMTQDPVSRARLGAARSVGGSLTSAVLAFIIGSQLGHADVDTMQETYLTYTIILAIFGYFLYCICFRSTKENVVRTVAQPSLKVSLGTVKRNGPLLMLCCSAIFVLIASFSVSSAGIYYVRYVVGDVTLFSIFVLVQMMVGSTITAFFVPSLVKRMGKKNTFLLGGCIGMVGNVIFFFLTGFNFYIALFGLAIASVGIGIIMTVIWALEADTVEYGEYCTGIRIEGLTYSLFSLTRKCGQAIGGSIPAFILGATGYVANSTQTPEVVLGIRSSISIVPFVALGCACAILFFYPLTEKRFAEIMREIAKRRTEKATSEALNSNVSIEVPKSYTEANAARANTSAASVAAHGTIDEESAKEADAEHEAANKGESKA